MSTAEFVTYVDIDKMKAELVAKHEALAELRQAFLEQQRQESAERRAEYERRIAEWQEETAKRQAETAKWQEESAKWRAETERQRAETERNIQEFSEKIARTEALVAQTTMAVERTNTAVGSLSNKVGEMVEKLVGEGNLVEQFRALGHNVKTHSRHKVFGEKGTAESGEIDLFMEDGDVSILVEVKTTLKMDHVVKHIGQMEKYRRFVDVDGKNGKRFIGAVAGTVIAENVINFAHESGLYVIIQSARAVEIIDSPEGFKAKEW